MKAKEYIQKNGWAEAENVIANKPADATHCDKQGYWLFEFGGLNTWFYHDDGSLHNFIPNSVENVIDLVDLKPYVDAYEFVSKYKNRHGGVRFRVRWGMFRYGDTKEFNENLKQAITLVEEVENYNEKTKEGDPS